MNPGQTVLAQMPPKDQRSYYFIEGTPPAVQDMGGICTCTQQTHMHNHKCAHIISFLRDNLVLYQDQNKSCLKTGKTRLKSREILDRFQLENLVIQNSMRALLRG